MLSLRTYVFNGYDQAVQPVTITVSPNLSIKPGTLTNLYSLQAYIPGGTSFQFNPPTGPSTYNWQAGVKAGTSVVFAMMDSQGRNGRYHSAPEGVYNSIIPLPRWLF